MLRLLELISTFSLLTCQVSSVMYELLKDYSGNNFFDDWDFFNGYDSTTAGGETYDYAKSAASMGLAVIDTKTKHALIKVDSETDVPYDGRRLSVKITTKATYDMGSLWIADIFHAPFGCGVWPTFWSSAQNQSEGGAITTFEGVNKQDFSYMALHTKEGCSTGNLTVDPDHSSYFFSTNCDDPLFGCATTTNGPSLGGASFNLYNGGIFVTEYASSGISIWFFPHDNYPFPSNSSQIDTTILGVPTATWPASTCGPDGFTNTFQPQSIIINISLCGNLGNALYNETCGFGNCFTDCVVRNGSNFAEAYYEIGSVRVFHTISGATTATTSSSSTTLANSIA
ncbi:hypothetical protein BDQ17DRAFT_1184773, partial [Cyathus striatus]